MELFLVLLAPFLLVGLGFRELLLHFGLRLVTCRTLARSRFATHGHEGDDDERTATTAMMIHGIMRRSLQRSRRSSAKFRPGEADAVVADLPAECCVGADGADHAPVAGPPEQPATGRIELFTRIRRARTRPGRPRPCVSLIPSAFSPSCAGASSLQPSGFVPSFSATTPPPRLVTRAISATILGRSSACAR